MKKLPVLLVFICLQASLPGQESLLDAYIREGLDSNLSLRQKEADYHKSLWALEEARGYFFPALKLQARYTVADGGRIIDFPVGDLLNPVYRTLNLLTGTQDFPDIGNESFRFYRPREQETKLELTQPLFDPDISTQYRLRRSLSEASLADMESFKRQLVEDIKSAYYGYMKARSMERLTSDTREVLQENLRVNRKLVENQLASVEVIYRSQAELAKLEKAEAEVEKQKQLAVSWFNFLLNREPGTPVETDSLPAVFPVLELGAAQEQALAGREEMDQLDHALDASLQAVRLYRGRSLPKLFAVVDYGFQGEQYRFSGEDDFVLASLVLSWDLFKGRQNRAKTRQALADQDKMEFLLEETRRRIELEAEQAWYDLQAARKSLAAAKTERIHSGEAFKQVDRRYREGNVSQLEWMDARNNLSTASEHVIQAEFDLAVSYAAYERVTAGYPIPEPQTP